jgi:predicted MFS family arabinose efflux permease
LFYLAFLVMAMRVSVIEVAATSFALIVATHSLGRTAGGWLLGELDAQGGLMAVFAVSALFIFVAGLFPLWASHQAAGAIGPGEEPAVAVLGAVTRD